MKRIIDDLFGELEYRKHFWRGKTNIQMFNMDMEITLSIDGHENADFPTIQREAFQNFKTNMSNIINEVEKQIYEYYNENFEDIGRC